MKNKIVKIYNIKFLAPTNTKGARVKIAQNDYKENNKTFDFNHKYNSAIEQALDILKDYNIIGYNQNNIVIKSYVDLKSL